MRNRLTIDQELTEDMSDPGADNLNRLTYAKIMMVDDEPINMGVVKAFLEDAGYRKFVLIDDSLQALSEMEAVRPDVLLLDLIMPHKNGFEVLKEIRQHPDFRHLPVVVLTSSTDTHTKLRALDLGATDFLSKPVDPSELVLRVRNAITVKAYQDQLVNYDPLTNLPNRRMFMKQLDSALSKAKRTRKQVALLNIEIDQFDKLSSLLGIRVSDEMLMGVAHRIKDVIRDSDDLARMPRDSDCKVQVSRFERGEFSVLLYAVRKTEHAALVADRIRRKLKPPIPVTGTEVFVTTSIGIAGYPNDSLDSTSLLRQAAGAKDYARGLGGDGFKFASKEINSRYIKRLKMDSELRKAVKNDELELNFQPKVEVATHRIKGVEALLRWNSRTMGPVSPYEFIALAEETGQIIEIGQWVVEQSCMVLKEWQGRFGMDLSLSLNLSARQFHNKGFLRMIRQAIFDSAVDPRSLTLEITESLLIDNVDHCMRTLSELKDTGASLSIDDFGTGYSSLSYLQRLPVDEIKIDKSFIADLETSVPSQAIASSVIYMSHNLGLTTVAEGVETEGQLEFLRTHACDTCQGFYFSRPLPKNGVEELIETVTSLMPISVNATE